jgi:DtxR family Mn-dependent transcriptional regulator
LLYNYKEYRSFNSQEKQLSQRTTEEYLESIGALEETENPVSTSSIAQSMGLSLASVSEMVRRLSDKGLVEYTPYGGTALTGEGKKRYLRLTRRHRLWEVFLNQHLGIGWEEVYPHACTLEHATSDLVAEKLDDFLGNPKYCPHGNSIPDKNLKRDSTPGLILAKLEAGQSARVLSVLNEYNTEFLRYLTSIGLVPGGLFRVMEKSPYDGTLTVEINGNTKAVGKEAASLITVEPIENQ